MSAKPERLYHFTCAHGRRAIGTSNCLLVPQIKHPTLGCKVTWLTSEAEPDRESTGLTSRMQPCDRMEFRYVVDDFSACVAWLDSPQRADASSRAVADAEEFGDPEHWWVAEKAIRARFDRSW